MEPHDAAEVVGILRQGGCVFAELKNAYSSSRSTLDEKWGLERPQFWVGDGQMVQAHVLGQMNHVVLVFVVHLFVFPGNKVVLCRSCVGATKLIWRWVFSGNIQCRSINSVFCSN